MIADTQELKKAAALHAVDYVRDGMVVGLGTGTTAEFALRELALRLSRGLRIVGVPTSNRTATLARQLAIPLTTLQHHPRLDLTIDGADEIDLSTFTVIKGLGGALLREKIVALATDIQILIVDHTKVVDNLGEQTPVPVEVVTFGWTKTSAALADLGCVPKRRTLTAGAPNPKLALERSEGSKIQDPKSAQPFKTDSGNYLIDCKFPHIQDPAALARAIKAITGVVEHGIFIRLASRIIVASPDGIMNYELENTTIQNS